MRGERGAARLSAKRERPFAVRAVDAFASLKPTSRAQPQKNAVRIDCGHGVVLSLEDALRPRV